MKKTIFFFIFLFVVTSVGVGQVAFAQEPAPNIPGIGNAIPPGPQTGSELFAILDTVVDWVFVVVITLSVIFIVLAGYQFITAGGDANAVAQARTKLLWGAIGIAVALLARGIPVIVNNILFG